MNSWQLMDNCAGEPTLSIAMFLYSSKPKYGSFPPSLALFSTRFSICTDFSARPFDCEW